MEVRFIFLRKSEIKPSYTLDTYKVELIWKAKLGVGKILFLLARYPTFVDVPLVLYCACNPHDSGRQVL